MKTKLAFSILVLALLWPAFFLPSTVQGRAQVNPGQYPPQDIQAAPRIQKLLDFKTGAVRDDGSSGLQRRRLAGEKAPASLNDFCHASFAIFHSFSDFFRVFGR